MAAKRPNPFCKCEEEFGILEAKRSNSLTMGKTCLNQPTPNENEPLIICIESTTTDVSSEPKTIARSNFSASTSMIEDATEIFSEETEKVHGGLPTIKAEVNDKQSMDGYDKPQIEVKGGGGSPSFLPETSSLDNVTNSMNMLIIDCLNKAIQDEENKTDNWMTK